jgi:nicotinamide-nucleotide amidase
VRIVAKAATQAEAETLVADFEARIRERLGAAIYATGDLTLGAVLADLLRERGATLAVAETLTGGDVTRRLSVHGGAFRGGIVASEGLEIARLLGLEWDGAGGEPGAVALAEGVRQAWGSSHGLAVVGDETDRAWVALTSDSGVDTRRLRFQGRDRRARTWTTTLALEFVRRVLLGLADGWAE